MYIKKTPKAWEIFFNLKSLYHIMQMHKVPSFFLLNDEIM